MSTNNIGFMANKQNYQQIYTFSAPLYNVYIESANRGIKHDFPFINIRKVPREVLKTEGEC